MEKQEYQVMYELENTYWWYVVLHELVESIVKQELHNNQKLQILDAGCGTGKMMEILSLFAEVYGLDYAEQAIDFCKKRGLENVVVANLNTWQPPLAIYDGIVSLDVLYHAAIDDDNTVLEKFYKALKPGGIVVLNLPAFNILRREHDAIVFNKRRYRKDQLKKQLQHAGFSIELLSYRLPHMFFIILLRKLFKKITFSKKVESDLKPLSPWINNLFIKLGRIENKLLSANITLPWGSSVFAVARKK